MAAACAQTDRPGCFICKAESQAAQVCRALHKKTSPFVAETVMESHHLSCSALSERRGRGRGGRDTRTGGKAGPRLKADQKNSPFPLTLIWSGLRQSVGGEGGTAETVSLIPRVSGCSVATSVTILVRWDLSVSQ